MSNGIFRKKSLDKISSPEQLNDYIKVANVSVWLVLALLICFLAGLCAWGFFGHMDTGFFCAAYCENGTLSCFICEDDMDAKVNAGIVVRVDGMEFILDSVNERPQKAGQVMDEYTLHLSNLSEDAWVYCAFAHAGLPNGSYSVYVLKSSTSPLSFLLN